MDYEKAYKNAIKIARELKEQHRQVVLDIFPELAESEDERIRKEIISIVKSYRESCITEGNHRFEECLAWLEKQSEKANPYSGISFEYNGHTWGMCARDNGVDILFDYELINHLKKPCEQKDPCEDCSNPKLNCSNFPCIEKRAFDSGKSVFECIKTEHEQKIADTVDPKFKVGDWLQYRSAEPFLVEEITEQGYINGNSCLSFEWENEIHLWSIQDAKDGDMLCTYECDEPKIVFILKGTPKKHYALSYHCYYNIMYPHFASDSEKGCLAPKDEDVKPSTKEQRELLFAKMKEAGYEWDADKKGCKK